jgi:hypothetical protein
MLERAATLEVIGLIMFAPLLYSMAKNLRGLRGFLLVVVRITRMDTELTSNPCYPAIRGFLVFCGWGSWDASTGFGACLGTMNRPEPFVVPALAGPAPQHRLKAGLQTSHRQRAAGRLLKASAVSDDWSLGHGARVATKVPIPSVSKPTNQTVPE